LKGKFIHINDSAITVTTSYSVNSQKLGHLQCVNTTPPLSPPQRLLLVNTSERKKRWREKTVARERWEEPPFSLFLSQRSPRALIFPLPSPRAFFLKRAKDLCGGERLFPGITASYIIIEGFSI